MLTSREIRVLHLESSDVCQASCPLCAREMDNGFDPNDRHNLSVSALQSMLSDNFVQGLTKMFMCGVYGDPAANPNTIAIYQWFRGVNPEIVLGMNTNGSLQNSSWWRQLAHTLDQPRDYVVFSIDGLEDTNSRYRIGVSWHKLLDNVRAFIDSGGQAHWDMLIYKHNQHQVDACQRLAEELGFRCFRAKVSNRPFIKGLEAPINWKPRPSVASSIKCQALKERSLYIDAKGAVRPCCWLGYQQQALEVEFDIIQQSWVSAHPNQMCVKTCSYQETGTRFEQQWQREVMFG